MNDEATISVFEDSETVTGFCACCGSGFEANFSVIGLEAPGLFGSWPTSMVIECPVCEREWEYALPNMDENHEHNRD